MLLGQGLHKEMPLGLLGVLGKLFPWPQGPNSGCNFEQSSLNLLDSLGLVSALENSEG